MDANTVGAVATLTGVSVRALHDDAGVDVVAHLLRRHALLTAQAHRLKDMITAVEELMSAHGRGIQLSAEEQVEIFGTTDFGGEYAAEAEQRWGDTDAWAQSQTRTAAFTKDDWVRIKADGDKLLTDLADAKRAGVAPGSPRADELAARHRASIEQFYECDADMQRCLVQMYLADERFTRYYDDVEPGLARFLHDIVVESHR